LPFHVAYPYLFEHEGEAYCVPETSQANEVGLFKALEFPFRWVKVRTLLNGFPAVDSTVFQYEGLWWLTCTSDVEGSSLKLFIWHSEDLFGPWKPHERNPVKTDIASSRPAGTPFVHDGRLYRPAQDCSRTYGGRVAINRVTKLTTTEFVEERVATIEPFISSPYQDGVHTISAAGDITMVDSKRIVFNKHAFKHSLIRNYNKLKFSLQTM
jgi:hypothetical protein